MMIDEYIQSYKDGFIFYHSEHKSYEICGIKVEVDVMKYEDKRNSRRKANVALQKDNLKYECECVDYHDWMNIFSCVTLYERTFLNFRKTLYGFTLLHTDTLLEEYEYFPEGVLNHQESFIIANAKSYGNLIIFDGCYWDGPDAVYVFDYKHKRFLNLSEEFGITWVNTSKIENDILILSGTDVNDEKIEAKVNEDEIYQLLNEKGRLDFMSW